MSLKLLNKLSTGIVLRYFLVFNLRIRSSDEQLIKQGADNSANMRSDNRYPKPLVVVISEVVVLKRKK